MTFSRFACLLFALIGSTVARAQIVIETPFFEGGSGKDFYLLAAREYEKVRPGVKVDMYLDPRIAEKVQVRLLEGDFPEITNPGTINYWPLIDNGDVLQVDEFLDGPSWDTVDASGKPVKWRDTFLPGSLNTYARDGKHYGIPLGYYAYVFWYNKKMFRDHGWGKPKTWDELFELCEKVKAKSISPMAFQGRYPYYATFLYDSVTYHLTGYNGYLARQNLAPGAIAAPESVRGIEITRRLAENYFQPGALGMSHTESQLQFFLGKTAMIPCGAWLKSEMLGKIPDGFELGCFNLPYLDESIADKTAVRVAAEPCITFSKSNHPREAMDFLRFMTSKKMAGTFSRMQDIPCAVRGANEGNLSKDLEELNEIVNAAKSSYGAVPGGGYPAMFQVYNDMLYDVIANEQLKPQQIADKYEERGQTIRRRTMEPEKVKVNHLWQPIVFLGLLGLGALYLAWRVATGLARRGKRAPQAGLHRMGFGNVILFVAPALILYSLFVIVPSARSFSWSLHSWNGLTNMQRMPFVGLQNFKRLLLESDDFWNALKNNLWLMFVIPMFVVPLSMFLAASISRGIWGAKLFRIVFFFPNMLGGVAATLLWLHLYNPNGGLVNSALAGIGIDSFKNFTWLEPKNLYWALIPISIWGTVGFNMVLYLAAMESVDETYYEAATIDGASKWRQFWTITVPLIWDVIVISLVFLIIGGMKAFEIIFLLCNQRPQGDAHVIATRMVQTMFYELRVGEAAAIAVLLFLMVFIGTAATMRGLKREAVEA
jgi:raffinose/stachyose/melibiose transport system permease protein